MVQGHRGEYPRNSSALLVGDAWPTLPLDEWQPTYATLHRSTQVVGETRLRLAPFDNYWWHCALYVTAHGLTTSPMSTAVGVGGVIEIELYLLNDVLVARTNNGDGQPEAGDNVVSVERVQRWVAP